LCVNPEHLETSSEKLLHKQKIINDEEYEKLLAELKDI
jgi:hypothetical protein